jgi:hypothetical protein
VKEQPTNTPAGKDFEKSLKELEQESSELKAKIDEERRRHEMPIDAKLGSPEWEQKAADGRLDSHEEDEE